MKAILKKKNKLHLLEIWFRAPVGRAGSIFFKGQLPHKSPSLSKDVSYNRWQAETDAVCPPASQKSESERDPAIHSTAILNQKNRDPAFWMTGDAELPSWSSTNEAFSLRLLQHQGVAEPHGIALKTLGSLSQLAHYLLMRLESLMQKWITRNFCLLLVPLTKDNWTELISGKLSIMTQFFFFHVGDAHRHLATLCQLLQDCSCRHKWFCLQGLSSCLIVLISPSCRCGSVSASSEDISWMDKRR